MYTPMDITTEMTAASMGKGRDGQCEVEGQDVSASPTDFRLSTAARVCEVMRQATTTLTS